MNRAEAAQLLTICASFDSRTIGESDVLAWHATLDDLPLEDSRAAVIGHYRQETRRVMPADVRAGVKRIRAERVIHPDDVPDADPDDVRGYVEALRADRYVKATGKVRELPPLKNVLRQP